MRVKWNREDRRTTCHQKPNRRWIREDSKPERSGKNSWEFSEIQKKAFIFPQRETWRFKLI